MSQTTGDTIIYYTLDLRERRGRDACTIQRFGNKKLERDF